jgi:hypothetical protein
LGVFVRQLHREPEADVLLNPVKGRYLDRGDATQGVDNVFHQHLGSRGAGRKPHNPNALEPRRVHLAAVCDKVARHPGLFGNFAQAIGVGAVLGANDQNEIGDADKVAHRALPVLRGVADVPRFRSEYVEKRCFSASISALVSSTESVVCVT